MKQRILIVDDEPNVLSAYQRALHRIYESDCAESAAIALDKIAKNPGGYSTIVTDMRMPGVSGLTLLKQVQRFAPDIVRVMMTGADDQKIASDAVNSGRVFRFIHKPCPGHIFLATIQEAVEHFQVAKRDRELLEKTFTGVVDMLTDMLASADPQSLRDAQRLRDRAVQVARKLDVEPMWEIKSAALLVRVGVVTLPSQILSKIRSGEQLSEPELILASKIPEIGAKLLENIPRLAPIAAIVRNQRRGFDGSGEPADGPTGCEIPIGARVLKPLIDIDNLERAGKTFEEALNIVRSNVQFYDPDVLCSLEAIKADEGDTQIPGEYRMAAELRAGMTLGGDATSDSGLALVIAGTKLTGVLIARLHNFSELGQLREPLFVYPPQDDESPNAKPSEQPTTNETAA